MKKTFIILWYLGLFFLVSCSNKTKQWEQNIKNFDVGSGTAIVFRNPLNDVLYPRDFHPPVFNWRDQAYKNNEWFVVMSCENMKITEVVKKMIWSPHVDKWNKLANQCVNRNGLVQIWGKNKNGIVSYGEVNFSISSDPVVAPVLFRSVPIPVPTYSDEYRNLRWVLVDLVSGNTKTMLSGKKTCFNCHSVSLDGSTIGLEINTEEDGRSGYITAKLNKQTFLKKKNIFNWNKDITTLDKKENGSSLSAFSPDGKYVIASINSKTLFVGFDRSHEFFSFFSPLTGILAYKKVDADRIIPLHGADNPSMIQMGPAWSPDGKWIVFARSKAKKNVKTLNSKQQKMMNKYSTQGLNAKYNVRFDLYKIPFNNGNGGTPVAIKGAGANNASNYLPVISPDQKWIAFTKSKYGFALQPDGDIYIVPFNGGSAHRLESNSPYMDSWHSWSPNSKWLVFSTKAQGSKTIMGLTHIDKNGHASVPVYLPYFNLGNDVINQPVFINRKFSDIGEMIFNE